MNWGNSSMKIIVSRYIIPIIILGLIVVGILFDLRNQYERYYQMQGQWATFDSQAYHQQIRSFPDGFRLDYPLGWGITTYERGGTKNLRQLRVSFTTPHFIFDPDSYLQVWWRRIDENWTLDDARKWFVKEIPFGLDGVELREKQDTFQKTTVGIGQYPALIQTFTVFSGENPHEQVVLLVVGDEAFAFSFHTDNYDEQTEQIFERMLDSLEIYE